MRRRPIFYMVGFLTPALFAVELTVLGGMRLANTGEYPDPFAPYEAIMPGQPVAALEQYPCQFEKALDREPEPSFCRIRPGEGVFSEVIVLFYNDKIWQVVFKTEVLRVGDLVQRWGYPDFNDDNGVYFSLQGHGAMDAVIALRNPMRRFNFLLPVSSLVLTDEG